MTGQYTAADPQTGETAYYLELAGGPLGGRSIRFFSPLTRYESEGHVYEADEGFEPRWTGGCCYEITLWYVRPSRTT